MSRLHMRGTKVHLMRSSRDTWCGREVNLVSGRLNTTRDTSDTTCLVCKKADEAETRKQQA